MKYALPAILIVAIGLLIFRLTADKKTPAQMQMETPSNIHTVVVDSVVQTSNYTYLKVKESNQLKWIAVEKLIAEVGETYSYDGQQVLEMPGFHSTELDRTFEMVYFIQEIFRGDAATSRPIPAEHQTNKPRTDRDTELKVKQAKGGITVGDLYSNKKKYQDQRVLISGKVVKVNLMVMGRNWIHIQDGTEGDGKYDLTITSSQEVEEGDIVTFDGKVSLDKDFGAGYFYEVILEDAIIKKD